MQNRRIIFAFLALSTVLFSCGKESSNAVIDSRDPAPASAERAAAAPPPESSTPTPAVGESGQPRTVRDFFMLLPEEYFTLEGCDRGRDKNCRQARIDYLKTFAEVEDAANGYLKGGCDGAQSCMEMALFKRPDGTYLVGLATFAEMMNDYYFLNHSDGKWTNVSSEVVPEFSKKNMYELPRYGTTVQVFAKKIVEQGADYEISEKGARRYDLEWKDGKFTIKR